VTTLFVSDLHLDASRPAVTKLFLGFLESDARAAETLYILGDLFESWIGDDNPNPHHARVIAGLKALTASGVPCYVMRGNRDFLLGRAFAEQSGCTLIEDPHPIELYGTPTVLMHGDTLCTGDAEYQAFRRMVHDPVWQRNFLKKPLVARRFIAWAARTRSKLRRRKKAHRIADVDQDTIRATMRRHGVERLIHGHTHRPGSHTFEIDDIERTRIVLGDWHREGSVLRCDDNGCQLGRLAGY
jgi:UDP-2,3-diacylglucosamine hydrolase